MDMTDKYPYLTAWIGFVASMSLGTLLFGFVLSFIVSKPNMFFLVFFLVVGFYVFRKLVIMHVLGSASVEELRMNQRASNLSSRYPFLTAWIGFLAIGLIPNVLISYLTYMIPGQILSLLIGYTIYVVANFFVFRFVVNRNIVRVLRVSSDRG